MAVSMACWSEGVRPLLRTAVGPVSAGDAGIAYTASLFGRQVLPVGAGAGPVITAFAIDRESALSYDETLAVVTVAEFVSTVASLALAAAGLLWLAWTGSFDADLWLVAALLLGFAGLLAAAATFVWYRRSAVCRGNERAVFHSYLYHQFGWVFVAIPLSVSAVALGVPLPFGLVCFVVPTSLTVEVLPLPGGSGASRWRSRGCWSFSAASTSPGRRRSSSSTGCVPPGSCWLSVT